MFDAERLMRGYIQDVCASPSAIAPERATELVNVLFGGKQKDIVFIAGMANVEAKIHLDEVHVAFAALLSLWAAAKAAVLIGAEAMEATRKGLNHISSDPGTPVAEAQRLLEVARQIIKDPEARWPDDLAGPVPIAATNTPDWHVNQMFLGAISWIILHEVAHLHLGHEATTTDAILKQQEHEADQWAVAWMLERAPADLQREFRLFAIAIGYVWLGLIDSVRRGSVTHPHAWERFARSTDAVVADAPELSPWLELAAHVIKGCFLPLQPISMSETPLDAFFEVLREAVRQPR